MNILHLTWMFGFLLLLTGCGERKVASPQSVSAADPAMEQYRRFVAEAQRLESKADVVLTVDGAHGEHSVRLVRPSLPGFTNDLSTVADFQTLVSALAKHDSAVIQLWAVGWDTNRVTNAVSHLRQVGFRSIRATAMRWGQSAPGPEL